jgi:NADPH2:quinone reductase
MKYVEASQFGGPEVLTVKEKETPKPGEGMLLVEVQAAGVNYADVAARLGSFPAVAKAPFLPGFEVAGVVNVVGNGVKGFNVGDSVAAITSGGGYASHAVIPAAAAIPIPRGLDHSTAAALLVQGLTAYLLLEQAQTKKDDVVLIAAAAGGVGSLAVQLAKARGATVIALASASKFGLVKSLGADHVFDYGQADWSTKVSDLTRSQGVQVFLDSTGDLAGWVFPLLGPFGRWIIYGVRRDQQTALPAEAIWSMIEKNISVSGFNLERHLEDVPRALGDLFKSAIDGNLKVEISKYPLADVSKVHTLIEQRKTTGKVALIP